MLEILAVLGSVGAFAIYQSQINDDFDGRLDNLNLDLSKLRQELNSHAQVSQANQETLEEKINTIKAITSASNGLIDEKINLLNQQLKDFLSRLSG